MWMILVEMVLNLLFKGGELCVLATIFAVLFILLNCTTQYSNGAGVHITFQKLR